MRGSDWRNRFEGKCEPVAAAMNIREQYFLIIQSSAQYGYIKKSVFQCTDASKQNIQRSRKKIFKRLEPKKNNGSKIKASKCLNLHLGKKRGGVVQGRRGNGGRGPCGALALHFAPGVCHDLQGRGVQPQQPEGQPCGGRTAFDGEEGEVGGSLLKGTKTHHLTVR